MNLAHAPHGGADGVNGIHYLGGEFLPFYVPREKMPQVCPEDYDELREFLRERGVSWSTGRILPSNVRAHQRINKTHALTIPPSVLRVPALLSEDWYVLDGNHRWFAHLSNGTLLPYHQISAPFEQAIDLLLAFPKTYTSTKHLEG